MFIAVTYLILIHDKAHDRRFNQSHKLVNNKSLQLGKPIHNYEIRASDSLPQSAISMVFDMDRRISGYPIASPQDGCYFIKIHVCIKKTQMESMTNFWLEGITGKLVKVRILDQTLKDSQSFPHCPLRLLNMDIQERTIIDSNNLCGIDVYRSHQAELKRQTFRV